MILRGSGNPDLGIWNYIPVGFANNSGFRYPPKGGKMQSIAFCNRCRGMKVGWNRRYLVHCFACRISRSKSYKSLILTVFASVLVLAFSTPTALVFSDQEKVQPLRQAARQTPSVVRDDPAVANMNAFLEKYKVDVGQRPRIAGAIVASGRKYNVDPRLVASIMIVESRANPFAISESDAIGIMQIHLPTWGPQADKEGINLFKIEDNIRFGTQILQGYIRRFGLWEGVKRYKGWNPESSSSAEAVSNYVAKVQGIYGYPKNNIVAQALQ